MTKKEKYYLFTTLQILLNCAKAKPLLDETYIEDYNKRLNHMIKLLQEL